MNTDWIKTIDLCRYYELGGNELRAVDQANIAIARGEAVAIVGKSGSGKTTLLNLLAGLDTPTAGRVIVDGQQLDTLDRHRLAAYRAKYIGMVFQAFNLLPHQTALKNVELPLYFDGTPRGRRKKLALQMLDRLGLAERLNHRPPDLSGGEQQRVAIARALVKQPQILLADEPTGNLDRENSQAIVELLNGLNRDGITVLIVTHDPLIASGCANRVLKMDYGRLVGSNGGPEVGGKS